VAGKAWKRLAYGVGWLVLVVVFVVATFLMLAAFSLSSDPDFAGDSGVGLAFLGLVFLLVDFIVIWGSTVAQRPGTQEAAVTVPVSTVGL
jgi:hypothetical protein